MACPIRNVFKNWRNSFLKMYFLPEFSRYNNDLWLKLTGQNAGKSFRSVLKTFLDLALESSVQTSKESLVQISFLVFDKSCFNFQKIKKFQFISYEICLKSSKSSFLTIYQNKTSTQMLVMVHIFIKKTIKINFGKLFFLGLI